MNESRFGFGKNWQDFVISHFSEERVTTAQKDLLSFLGRADLQGLSFLDIGCGSGLTSLAAHRSGAVQVYGFDYDADSVATSSFLRNAAAQSSVLANTWRISRGDVLDSAFMKELGKFDIVCSWGVLHHTGDMWRAIENAAASVNENGVLYIALYSRTSYANSAAYGQPTPEEWLEIKKKFNAAGEFKKKLYIMWYIWRRFFKQAKVSPVKIYAGWRELRQRVSKYASQRGMDFFTDIRDWLGGWPMDFVNEPDLQDFMELRNFDLLRMDTGRGNSIFLFRRKQAVNWWNNILAERKIYTLDGPFRPAGGHAWAATLPFDLPEIDAPLVRLCENGKLLRYAECPPKPLTLYGMGRYRCRKGELLFTTSDNSNPNTNARGYSCFIDMREVHR